MIRFKTNSFRIGYFLVGFALMFLGWSGAVNAHSVNESYVFFNVTDDGLSGRVEISTKDLARVFEQGVENKNAWTREEALANAPKIFAYFDGRLVMRHDGQDYSATFNEMTFLKNELVDGSPVAQLRFDFSGLTPVPEQVEVSYDFMFSDVDPDHRGFALIESNTRTGVRRNSSHFAAIFEPDEGFQTIYLNGEPRWNVFVDFVIHGVWHIWLGFDHVLFLITLLLTSVMVIRTGRWEPADSLGQALRSTLIIVTVFTLAHSVTLALAAFGIITLPVVLVEAIIALSIAFVALGNMFPQLHLSSWKVILVFGLFHGFGFANVLAPLGLDPARKAVGLAAFNIGVELGQIAIVIVVFPILFILRGMGFYRPLCLYAASVFLIGIALFWFIERTYDVLGPVRQMVFG